MDFQDIIKEFEASLKQERIINEELSKRCYELQRENEFKDEEIMGLQRLIKDEHPMIHEMTEYIKRRNKHVAELNKEQYKLNDEIKALKAELAESEKFNSDNIAFLMEALRKEPLRVVIESGD